MRKRMIAAGLLAMALAATPAAAQPSHPVQETPAPPGAPTAGPTPRPAGSSTRPGPQFCASVRRTLQLFQERGPRGFAILPEYEDWGEDHPNVGRRPLIPGFTEMSFSNSELFLSARLHGGFSAFDDARAEQIAREMAEAISGCYPGTTVTEQRRRDETSYGVSLGRDRPSFSTTTKTNTTGFRSVTLSITMWKPGKREEFERERGQYRDAYTREGCAVGDDVCKSRRLMGR